jgi:acetyl-CoA carboxylase biotin carboxyl carrier protein
MPGQGNPNQMQMRLDDVEKLVEMVARSQVSEVTVEEGSRKVTVRRAPVGVRYAVRESDDAQTPPAGDLDEPAVGIVTGTASDESLVTAPMVGVFRHTDHPVGVGRSVVPGQVVGAIESMKLMNDVRAATRGVVAEVLVEDGAPVEYGQPLLALREA